MAKYKTPSLFADLPEQLCPNSINIAGLDKIWTEHKAQLVAAYLKNFTWVTKHGCYIDGFAGPRLEEREGSWSAELVLANEPRWLRQFHLCDQDPSQFDFLEKLKDAQPEISNRSIKTHHGDFNDIVDSILDSDQIGAKTAAFTLLDQFTCECHWSTVRKLANHKPPGANKIEILYFLATGWIHRSLSKFTSEVPDEWWGTPEWRDIKTQSGNNIARRLTERFRDELGYKWSHAYPIYKKEKGGGRVMFHLIHATDHPAAPKLMKGAYRAVVKPPEEQGQIDMEVWAELVGEGWVKK